MTDPGRGREAGMGRNPLVMIIDEDPIYRQELQAMLTPARLAVVADCGYGVEAASLAEELKPDLILASVEEPIGRAIQTIEAVRRHPAQRPGHRLLELDGAPAGAPGHARRRPRSARAPVQSRRAVVGNRSRDADGSHRGRGGGSTTGRWHHPHRVRGKRRHRKTTITTNIATPSPVTPTTPCL